MRFLKKDAIYYLRTSRGYVRVKYIIGRKRKRVFHSLDNRTQYTLSVEEAEVLISRVPRMKGALKRMNLIKKINRGGKNATTYNH